VKRALLLAGGALALGLAGVAAVARATAQREPLRHVPVVVTAEPMLEPVVIRLPAPSRRRTPFMRARDGEPVPVLITAYCLSGTTRRGRWVRPGIVAADPRVFPLSRYVELFDGQRYLGKFLVDDTGGMIKGEHIDMWVPTCREATIFGRVQGTAVLVPRRRR
jgi:3D (Asp-Asp-Asp) domain-containing protein